MSTFLDRMRGEGGEAERLQAALERLGALRAEGVEDAEARRRAAEGLPYDVRRAFQMALAVQDARAAAPAPAFADDLEQRLRAAAAAGSMPDGIVVDLASRRRRVLPSLAAVAAGVILFAAIGQGAVRSLPGDPLYGVKESGRSVRLGVLSGRSQALLRVSMANDRFAEVDRLVDREQSRVVGVPGSMVASSAGNLNDRIVRLIADTLRKARTDLIEAAQVLLKRPDRIALVRLEVVVRRGQETVTAVGPVLPEALGDPEISTVESLADVRTTLDEIAVAAASKREAIDKQEPEPTLAPCATPSPTPTVSPSASPSPDEEPSAGEPTASPSPSPEPQDTPSPNPKTTASPTASPSPTPSPTPSPSPTPCASRTPSPTPSPTAPAATARPSPKPTTAPTAEPDPTAAPSASPEPTQSPPRSSATQEPESPKAASSSCNILLRLLGLCR